MNRKKFFKLIGPRIKRVPLNPKIISKKNFGDYTLEKISYSVEKHEKIEAYLLVPNKIKKNKFPAVLCHHEHASKYLLAKSEIAGIRGNKNLFYAKELAQKGFITMAVDAIGFESRNKIKKNWWGVEYHEMASRIVQGRTLLQKNLSDLSIAVNYLFSRNEVNKEKIGFIGHSFGGRMALILPAFDKRIKVSVSNCYARQIKNALDLKSKTRIPMEFVIPNLLKFGDFSDFLKLSNNADILISVTKNDKWSQDAKEIYIKAKKYFNGTDLTLKKWKGKHKFTKEMREFCYEYLSKKLNVKD